MFSFLKSNPIAQLEKKRAQLLKEAMEIQRSGDLRKYAVHMSAIEDLDTKLEELYKARKTS